MSTPITLTGACTCTHHNDQQRAACPVCLVAALTAERDQLRAEVEKVYALVTPVGCDLGGGIFETAQAVSELLAHAERAEADLTAERARLDWLESPAGVDWQWSSSALTIRRAVIDAAMKEDAK